jgi:hypothetical protein
MFLVLKDTLFGRTKAKSTTTEINPSPLFRRGPLSPPVRKPVQNVVAPLQQPKQSHRTNCTSHCSHNLHTHGNSRRNSSSTQIPCHWTSLLPLPRHRCHCSSYCRVLRKCTTITSPESTLTTLPTIDTDEDSSVNNGEAQMRLLGI